MKKEKSEFGKGLIICLVNFYQHFHPQNSFIKNIYSDKRIVSENAAVTTWANRAANHLSEIETPKGKDWNYIRKLVKKLQANGLEIGHGFLFQEYTIEDVSNLKKLTKRIIILIDKKLGLKADWGSSNK